jgi:hypothetical protein
MNKIAAIYGITVWFFMHCAAFSCPAGYESQVALARSARLIIGVKVETVTDAPAIISNDGRMPPRDGEDPGKSACAVVEITETVRGTCSLKA